jgi:hypothetical protein
MIYSETNRDVFGEELYRKALVEIYRWRQACKRYQVTLHTPWRSIPFDILRLLFREEEPGWKKHVAVLLLQLLLLLLRIITWL